MSFLTIYTPTFQRPSLLQACVASVCAQTAVADIQHLVIRDEVGVGIAGMFAEIGKHVQYMTGKYVYVLQDDDILADNEVVADLQRFATAQQQPEVIIVRNKKRNNVYPSNLGHFLQVGPKDSAIDLGNYAVRRDVFRRHVQDFGTRYAGDLDFITVLWQQGYRFAVCDRLFAVEQLPGVPGLGRPEKELVRS
ncbi:MAG: hypothetical protein HC804_00150 [Anaerolineae bacterium]|nr:hypothetical protein [Anaerolineae bacterium]